MTWARSYATIATTETGKFGNPPVKDLTGGGLKEWKSERGYLRDTCLAAQDKFKLYLDYFKVKY